MNADIQRTTDKPQTCDDCYGDIFSVVNFCPKHAATDDLLAALRGLLSWVENEGTYRVSTPYSIRVDCARSAIYDATGGQS